MYSVREQNKINKRRCILEAAMHLFSKKGYEQTSIEELAKQAGIGKGTVYSYFQTKKDIVRAFCEDELEVVRHELAAKTSDDTPLHERLLIMFIAEFKHITRNKEFGRIYFQEKVFPREPYTDADFEVQGQFFEVLYPIYQQAQKRGELRNDLDLLHIAGHFYALELLVLSCWYNGMIPTEQVPEAMETLINQTLEGLKPDKEQVVNEHG